MTQKVSVIGAGTMGTGIAQLAATNGSEVNIIDSSINALENSKKNLNSILCRLVDKGKISDQRYKEIITKISWTDRLQDISDSGIVFEAIIEDIKIKQNLFLEIEMVVSEKCILATNTSSLSVKEIGSVCKNTSRFMGVHFFNPVSLMKLVEMIPLKAVDLVKFNSIKSLLECWGKTVVAAKDTPGFIVNRVARPYYGEALRIYEEKLANFETIDWAMKEFGGFRMGPFELMDYIGNDVNYSATLSVYNATNKDPHYSPSYTQKNLVDSGMLGRKTGKGFYNYSDFPKSLNVDKDEHKGKMIFNRIISMLINEAANALDKSIGTKEDIDIAMTKGVNYPKGLLKWGDELGLEFVKNQLENLYVSSDDARYLHSPLLDKLIINNSIFFNE